MQTIAISQNMDVSTIPQIDRVADSQNIYIIETKADYANLPQPVKDMYGPDLLAQLSAP